MTTKEGQPKTTLVKKGRKVHSGSGQPVEIRSAVRFVRLTAKHAGLVVLVPKSVNLG